METASSVPWLDTELTAACLTLDCRLELPLLVLWRTCSRLLAPPGTSWLLYIGLTRFLNGIR